VLISLVVRAKNEGRHLPRLIEGINAQDVSALECILVDSGSTDNTIEIAGQAGWKIVQLASDRFTFGRSLNLGCSVATGDVIIILSAHVYPLRVDYLRKMLESIVENPQAVAYGRQVGNMTTRFSERMVMSNWFPAERITDQGHAFTNNANSAVHRELWERFRYNEELSGLEDIDFSARVLASGGQVTYVSDAPVVDVHEETFRGIYHRYHREAVAYKQIFPGERMSARTGVSLFARNVFRDLQFARSEGVLRREFTSVVEFRFAQFFAAWNGFREGGSRESDLQRKMYHPGEFGSNQSEDAVSEVPLIVYRDDDV